MQFTKLTAEQTALQEVARDLLGKESSPARVREGTEARQPFDRRLWNKAGELGWHGLEAAAEKGGSAQTFVEVSLVLRELGRTTTAGPYLSQQLALHALDAVPDHPVAESWTERLVSGEAIGAVIPGVLGRDGLTRPSFVAEPLGPASYALSGSVLDSADVGYADLVLIAASAGGDPVIFAVERPGEMSIIPRPTHDRTRSLFDVRAERYEIASSAIVASGPRAAAMIDSLWCRAATGIALDGVGGAAKALEMTVSYTSQRVQYGRVIATFQAVKHTCADMYVESEVARIAADAATLEIATSGPRSRFWSSVAKFRAGDAYASVTGDALQMHGGIGMTWEFDLHYWLKRAKLNQVLFGNSDAHRARVARGV